MLLNKMFRVIDQLSVQWLGPRAQAAVGTCTFVLIVAYAVFMGCSAAPETPGVWSAPINLLRVPLAWGAAFPLGMGAAGIWWAINITTVIKCAGKWSAVVRGRWTESSL